MKDLLSYSIYSILNHLEEIEKFNLDYIPSNLVQILSNPLLFGCSNDIDSIEFHKSKVILKINNLSLLGIQGPLPNYFLKYCESNKVKDFLNIFNHRLVQIAYSMHKSTNIFYYNLPLLKQIISNFTLYLPQINAHIFKESSVSTLNSILSEIAGPGSYININIAEKRIVKHNHCRFLFNKSFTNLILGAKFYVNDSLDIGITVKSYNKYLKLIEDINIIYTLMHNYYSFIKINIFLERSQFTKATLNKSWLGRGIYL